MGAGTSTITASNAWQKCPIDTIQVDTESAWNVSNKWYVIPRTGLWEVSGSMSVGSDGALTGNQQNGGLITRNGGVSGNPTSNYLTYGANWPATTMATGRTLSIPIPPTVVSLTVGDTVQLNGLITSTGNVFFDSAATPRMYTGMLIRFISDPP